MAAANSGFEQKVFETGKLKKKKNRRIKANASSFKNGGDSGTDGMSLKIMREQNKLHLDNHCYCQHILMYLLECTQILCVSLCLCLYVTLSHTPLPTQDRKEVFIYLFGYTSS